MKELLALAAKDKSIMKRMANFLEVFTYCCRFYFVPMLTSLVHVSRLYTCYYRHICLQNLSTLLLPAHLLCQGKLPEGFSGCYDCYNCLVHRDTDCQSSNLPTHRFFLDSHQARKVLELQRYVPWDWYCRHINRPFHSAAPSPHGIHTTAANKDKGCGCRYLRARRICCHYKHSTNQLHLSAQPEIRYVSLSNRNEYAAYLFQCHLRKHNAGLTFTWLPHLSALVYLSTNLYGLQFPPPWATLSATMPAHSAPLSVPAQPNQRTNPTFTWAPSVKILQAHRFTRRREI
jgi:hypothetical protein